MRRSRLELHVRLQDLASHLRRLLVCGRPTCSTLLLTTILLGQSLCLVLALVKLLTTMPGNKKYIAVLVFFHLGNRCPSNPVDIVNIGKEWVPCLPAKGEEKKGTCSIILARREKKKRGEPACSPRSCTVTRLRKKSIPQRFFLSFFFIFSFVSTLFHHHPPLHSPQSPHPRPSFPLFLCPLLIAAISNHLEGRMSSLDPHHSPARCHAYADIVSCLSQQEL